MQLMLGFKTSRGPSDIIQQTEKAPPMPSFADSPLKESDFTLEFL